MVNEPKIFKKAQIVSVDMGYGHQRAAYPLSHLAFDGVLSANTYKGIPKSDMKKWENSRRVYEVISRMKHLPFIGKYIFDVLDYFQKIEPFYPMRDLSEPIIQVRSMYKMISKGWGKDLINRLNKNNLPLITSFFIPAFFAEEHRFRGDIYCICTDADVSRAWAPLDPRKSRIKYLVPNKRVKERLRLYGVRSENLFVTGFPLPKENLGGPDWPILKENLSSRIVRLDPLKKYRKKYGSTIKHYLGSEKCIKSTKNNPITITFAVGGAGAQRELGVTIMESLRLHLMRGEVKLNLVAGVRKDVYSFFKEAVKEYRLNDKSNGNVKIIFEDNKVDYFDKFNEVLKTTDILWTKPSELSFFAGLGLPIIMAPTIGSQEDFNKSWLHAIGAGVEQEDPRYTNEWLFEWVKSGWLAEAAMQGFLDAPKNSIYHIEDIVLKGKRSEIEDIHLL
ncbi:MAG: hypothetical protein L3J07_02610 [Candidatus Magasanikbacteria bacterium]|nr:hypothetical protein [Candidatus Magasanikbacteria bacterium]